MHIIITLLNTDLLMNKSAFLFQLFGYHLVENNFIFHLSNFYDTINCNALEGL